MEPLLKLPSAVNTLGMFALKFNPNIFFLLLLRYYTIIQYLEQFYFSFQAAVVKILALVTRTHARDLLEKIGRTCFYVQVLVKTQT